MTDATTARPVSTMILAELLECIAINSDMGTHASLMATQAADEAEETRLRAEADRHYDRRNAAMQEVLARHRRGDL